MNDHATDTATTTAMPSARESATFAVSLLQGAAVVLLAVGALLAVFALTIRVGPAEPADYMMGALAVTVAGVTLALLADVVGWSV